MNGCEACFGSPKAIFWVFSSQPCLIERRSAGKDSWWVGVCVASFKRHSHGEDKVHDVGGAPPSRLCSCEARPWITGLDEMRRWEIMCLFPGKYPCSLWKINQLSDVRSCIDFYTAKSLFGIKDPEDPKGPLETPEPGPQVLGTPLSSRQTHLSSKHT